VGRGFESLQGRHKFSYKVFTKTILDDFIKSRASGTSLKTIKIYHLALDNCVGYPITPVSILAIF